MKLDPKDFKTVHGNVGFNPLPKDQWEHGALDDLCCCPWCSKSGASVEQKDGIWDTQATCLLTGKTWKVHYPQLHGRRRKRADRALGEGGSIPHHKLRDLK